MNASKKILLAAIIVAAGYGTAALCGRPHAASPLPNQSPADSPSVPRHMPDVQLRTTTLDPAPMSRNAARLVPDTSHDSASQAVTCSTPDLLPVRRLEETAVVQADPSRVAEPPAPSGTYSAVEHSTAEPRASLRDEAPRPLGFNARSEAAMSRMAPLAVPSPAVDAIRADVGRSQQLVDGSTENPPQPSTPSPARTAAWNAPLDAQTLTPVTIHTPAEEDEPRSHIVVDGDSLAKLAGRYLDDPHRADEIYQLNRDLLSDPELLPIGVELTIPVRAYHATDSGLPPQSSLPRTVAIHSRYGNALVPVRPIPATSTLTPRARLVSPRLAE